MAGENTSSTNHCQICGDPCGMSGKCEACKRILYEQTLADDRASRQEQWAREREERQARDMYIAGILGRYINQDPDEEWVGRFVDDLLAARRERFGGGG